MKPFSTLNLVKSSARSIARFKGIKLSEAQRQIATESGFKDYHELQKVAGRCPSSRESCDLEDIESRLACAAFGLRNTDRNELLIEDHIYGALDSLVENKLSSYTADTNAGMFRMENIETHEADYDPQTGVVSLSISFSYDGDQDWDRMYFGSSFGVDAIVRLKFRDELWELADDPLEITAVSSEADDPAYYE